MLAIIRIGIDPIAFHLGSLAVHWYGIMYALAFIVAYQFGLVPYLEPRGIPRATIEKFAMWGIFFGLIGGRLYYVVQSGFLNYLEHPINIIAVWQGGMAFYGAIFAALLTMAVLARRHRISFWLLLDGGAMFGAIGQPIGRIGNFINGDILGGPSTLPWATAYTNPNAVLQPGFSLCTPAHCVAYLPAEIFEAIGTLCILGILLYMNRRKVRQGVIGITFIALYSVSQLIVFTWRINMPTWFGLKQAQLTAIAVLLIAVPLLIYLWRRTEGRKPSGPDPAGSNTDLPHPESSAADALPASG